MHRKTKKNVYFKYLTLFSFVQSNFANFIVDSSKNYILLNFVINIFIAIGSLESITLFSLMDSADNIG